MIDANPDSVQLMMIMPDGNSYFFYKLFSVEGKSRMMGI